MTGGAAYDPNQTVGWKYGLSRAPSPRETLLRRDCSFTVVAVAINFIGIDPMKALVVDGIVQGFSTPPLMLLIRLMTNDRSLMGERVNGRQLTSWSG